jgi:multicomponent K+:H+ antiporter subunit D
MAALVVASSFCGLVALMRAGVQIWWAEPDRISPAIRLSEIAPVLALLGVCLAASVVVEGPFAYLQRAARQLGDPAQYVGSALGAGTRP